MVNQIIGYIILSLIPIALYLDYIDATQASLVFLCFISLSVFTVLNRMYQEISEMKFIFMALLKEKSPQKDHKDYIEK